MITANVGQFTCGGSRHQKDPYVELCDRFLRDEIWAACDECAITRTWGAFVEGTIAGYVALAADAIGLSGTEKKEAELGEELRYRTYGCTQIVMIAVRADLQGSGLHVGSALVEHAVFAGREIGSRIGARFLTADVNPSAMGFYESCNFRSLLGQTEELKRTRKRGLIPMVIDLWPNLAGELLSSNPRL
jgi:GNAT superfamily N-acetyltransferase